MTPSNHIPKGAKVAWLDRPEPERVVHAKAFVENSRQCVNASRAIVREAQRLIDDGHRIMRQSSLVGHD